MPVESKDKRPLKARLLEYRKQKKRPIVKEDPKQQPGQQNTPPSTQNEWPRTATNETQRHGSETNWQYSQRPPADQFHQNDRETQPARVIPVANALEAPPWRNILDNFFTIDLLDNYPMRKWREFCTERPLRCWLLTGIFWATGQLLAAKAQFGFVFLVLFLLLLLLLNLGIRKEGELSAYSVFNPNYERLLGELTGEDFEREVLMRRRKVPESHQ